MIPVRCPFVFGSKQCGSTKPGPCDHTLERCIELDNEPRFGGLAPTDPDGNHMDDETLRRLRKAFDLGKPTGLGPRDFAERASDWRRMIEAANYKGAPGRPARGPGFAQGGIVGPPDLSADEGDEHVVRVLDVERVYPVERPECPRCWNTGRLKGWGAPCACPLGKGVR